MIIFTSSVNYGDYFWKCTVWSLSELCSVFVSWSSISHFSQLAEQVTIILEFEPSSLSTEEIHCGVLNWNWKYGILSFTFAGENSLHMHLKIFITAQKSHFSCAFLRNYDYWRVSRLFVQSTCTVVLSRICSFQWCKIQVVLFYSHLTPYLRPPL